MRRPPAHATRRRRKEPEAPEPSLAERARTLVHVGRTGALASLSRHKPGLPFGSVAPYALDDLGRPIFLMSAMAMHTQNVLADARASLLVTQPGSDQDPLGSGRVTLLGEVRSLTREEVPEPKRLYLDRHPKARYWVEMADFAFYRLAVTDVYFVGGFGVMGWVEGAEYACARPALIALARRAKA